jgi:U3 small nucleolar RNA-associated protein MPP10
VEEDDERAGGKKDRRLGEGKGRNGRPAAVGAGALSQWKSKKTGNSKDGADAKYEDFFGPREPSQVARKSAQKNPSGKQTRSLKGARFPDASGDFDNHEDDEESGSGGDFKGEDDFDRMLEERDMSGSDDAEGDDYGHSDDEDDDDEHIEEEEGEGEGSSVGQEDAKASKALSRHQQRQARLAEQVRQLEAEAVGEKSWELKGEVRAVDRPENSLLSVTMEVERCVS